MPRGGRRTGAGRKPGRRPGGVLTSPAWTAAPAGPPPDPAAALRKAPRTVEPAARAVWRRLAPLALVERTLTPATAAGFAELCRQWVYVEALAATIGRLGAGTREADGYLKQYGKLSQRLDGSLARFNLTAHGKPAAAAPAPAAANPWAVVARAGA